MYRPLPSAHSRSPGLFYRFESRDDFPFNGIRQLSRGPQQLLFKLYSEVEAPDSGFSLYKKGMRFSSVFEEDLWAAREEERQKIEEKVEFYREMLRCRGE